jgi:hypothetical protein
VAVHPLRPATDHGLGRPLPHQLANQPQVPPKAALRPLVSAVSSQTVCGISSDFSELFPTFGQIPTCYSPVCHYLVSEEARPFDLHALGTPPAFILSQDQTLHTFLLVMVPALFPDPISSSACEMSRGRGQLVLRSGGFREKAPDLKHYVVGLFL